MTEATIDLSGLDTLEFYGRNDAHLNQIKNCFPRVKIIGRGETLKLLGESRQLVQVKRKIAEIIQHLQTYNSLNRNALDRILSEGAESRRLCTAPDVLVHGVGGVQIKAQTQNQRKMVSLTQTHDMVFAVGPAGTGKTYTGVALAVRALKNKQVKRIILTRPAVEAGERIGFLPGDLKEKLDPYLQPLYDALRDMIPSERLNEYMERKIIQIAPLGFMRGRTLDHAFVILDEAQNTTHAQMKMFLTRMGERAKFIITGDPGQIDLPSNQKSGLLQALVVLQSIEGIALLHLDECDVVRHPLVKQVLKAYREVEQKKEV